MKKLALALISMSAALFGFGAVSQTQAARPVYINPGSLFIETISPNSFIVYSNCVLGAGNVTFFFKVGPYLADTAADASQSSACVAFSPDAGPAGMAMGFVAQTSNGGIAQATFNAPAAPGSYPGTATQNGVQVGAGTVTVTGSGVVGSPAQPATTLPGAATTVPAVTTPPGGLPATGAGGLGTTTTVALGLLAVGSGLLIVAQVRRRQPQPT